MYNFEKSQDMIQKEKMGIQRRKSWKESKPIEMPERTMLERKLTMKKNDKMLSDYLKTYKKKFGSNFSKIDHTW